MSGVPDKKADRASMSIVEGYRPGLIGQVVALHATTYSQWAGFGRIFEAKVASEFAGFVTRLDRPANGIWHAADGDRILGSIAIDGEDLADGEGPSGEGPSGERAHLRWFIVDPSSRGTGLGRRLLDQALAFVDERHFTETHLWTLKGLEAAKSLYLRAGFVLAGEYEGDQWGVDVTEQTFVRRNRVSS